MNLWQTTAADKMAAFITDFFPASKVNFAGSMLDSSSLDVFSDVDMKISLSDNIAVNMEQLIKALSEQFHGVFGYQVCTGDGDDLLRICFDNGWRFDLTFIYPLPPARQTADASFTNKINETVHLFWFLSSLILAKLGRKDFLIAAHLALELCQLSIVVQMLIRDEEMKTNIHRFGNEEDVPILHSLICDQDDTEHQILHMLFHAAGQMDITAKQLDDNYCDKRDTLKAFYCFKYTKPIAATLP
ncbi:MAG: hypothetical protein FWD03_01600 [Defluviitaleaceae bacterium]|nr:hypothetical protein [Defluviitaleaceae bacterium]